jgi:hypothetical protein
MFSAISIIELRLVVAHGFTFFVSVIRPSVGCTQLAERTLHYFRLSPRDAEKRKKSKRGLAESVSIFILMMH